MSFVTWTVLFAIGLFFATVASVEFGRFLRARRRTDVELKTGTIDGAIFGLVGLLFGFAFYGAAERFLDRRELIIEEANAIGTAYYRVDLVQRDRQPPMREAFRTYLDARLAAYANPDDRDATRHALEKVALAREELWRQVVESLRAPEAPAQVALAVPTNEMFDIGEKRVQTTRIHPPHVIYALLTMVSLIASLLGGYGLTGPPVRLHTLVYAAVMACTVFVIIELEYPRLGLIRVDDADKILIDLRASMKDAYRSSR